jgi:crotonobetainyl-CoA:carnitine CoA-transferase CaiB-like acyl-CoA transferase
MWNRGKRAIALDLKHPEAQEIIRQLVTEADVFLTSILPGQRKSLGIDQETIQSANPGIVYASGTGVGSKGPESDKGGYDGITFWARSGAASAATRPGADPVTLPMGAFGDATSGMALAGGVAAALARKARTGEGAVVECSLLATAMWAMQMGITGTAAAGIEEFPRTSRQRPFNVLVNTYPTADNRWVSLCMLQADRYWAGFCHAIGRADLEKDPRFDNAAHRAANAEACVAELESTFRRKTLGEWRERLATQEGQWDALNTVSEVRDDPQVKANEFTRTIEYPSGHQLTIVGAPVQFDNTPTPLRRAPEFGADTDEVLQDLGWGQDAILDAKIKGAVV